MIWERYFFKEILKVFALFLGLFYFLYAVMDYSTHMQDFTKDAKLQLSDIGLYYFYQFIKRASLLIPLGLMIASIKVLCTLNTRRELLALQASGISLKRLLRPFFAIAIACTLLNYLSTEFLLPRSLNYADEFHHSHFHRPEKLKKEPIHVIHLKDHSKLVYQIYDSHKTSFFDVIWLISSNEIWQMKYLKADAKDPVGYFVDHLKRNKEGVFEKLESYDTYRFETLKWNQAMANKRPIPVENRSLSELFRLLFQKKSTTSYDKPEIFTQFLFKAILPLLSLLVIVATTPFCIRYSRSTQTFFIYAISLFGFVSFFTLMNGAVILGENQTASPLWTILFPFFACSAAFGWKFSRSI